MSGPLQRAVKELVVCPMMTTFTVEWEQSHLLILRMVMPGSDEPVDFLVPAKVGEIIGAQMSAGAAMIMRNPDTPIN